MSRYSRNGKLVISASILLPVLLLAAFGPLFAPHDPLEMNTRRILEKSSPEFPLGTDEYGRCIASRLIIGVRPSLFVAVTGTALALAAGTALGASSAYIGGKLGSLAMRAVEVVLCFPPILLAMLVASLWGAGISELAFVVGLLYAPHFARVTHASTLRIRRMEFIESEIAIGSSAIRVLGIAVLPNILSPIIIQASLTMANAILLESGLSFLGLGVQPPAPSWGQMIGDSRNYLGVNAMYTVWPALFLSLTILATNLLGDALRDLLDPRLKGGA